MPRRKTDRISLPNAALNDNASPHNQAWAALKTLVDGGVDASRLLELYYWCREPGVVELIRVYLEIPERARRALGDYLLNVRPGAIEARSDTSGRLVLTESKPATNKNKAEERWSSRP
jgi:hypothetical protein